MIAVWVVGAITGLVVTVWASRKALSAASRLGKRLGLSPFVIGMTIVAVGTDLPEIANSIVASASGHGDLNVGDSIGSVVTQATLVLGIICLIGTLKTTIQTVVTAGSLTVLALIVGAGLINDQQFSRLDGLVLITIWIVGTIVIQRPDTERRVDPVRDQAIAGDVGRSVLWLSVVGAGAVVAVQSFIRLADDLGAPEFLLSFFVLALGTSLPELVIAYQAVRRSEGALALGDLLGSSFVDATLSVGIGPLLFPTALSAGMGRSNLVVAFVIASATAILARDGTHRWGTGIALILLYIGLYPALIT